MSQEERLTLDIAACARLLGISRGSAYSLAAEGKLPTIRLGRRVVIPKAAFDAWLDSAGGSAVQAS